jgi:hypothetical protein
MDHTPPFPVMDLSGASFVVALAAAGRSHVGDYAPDERPRLPFRAEHLAWARIPGRTCLYCSQIDPVGGEEHVLSVALGNWFWVIPPDVVCARCNNEVLSRLDMKLQQHPFIALIRVLSGVAGREGQPPRVGASNMVLRRDENGELNIETNHRRHVDEDEESVSATVRWSNFGPRQRREIARALLKVGLGTAWLARGPAETSQQRWNHVRDAVLEVGRVPLRTGFGNSELPGHALQVLTIAGVSTAAVRVSFNYFGVELWVETEGFRDQASPEFLTKEIDIEFNARPDE